MPDKLWQRGSEWEPEVNRVIRNTNMNQISISVDLLIDEGDTISIDNTLHRVRVVSEEEIQLAVPGSTIDVVMSPEELAEKIGESKIVYIQK